MQHQSQSLSPTDMIDSLSRGVRKVCALRSAPTASSRRPFGSSEKTGLGDVWCAVVRAPPQYWPQKICIRANLSAGALVQLSGGYKKSSLRHAVLSGQ